MSPQPIDGTKALLDIRYKNLLKRDRDIRQNQNLGDDLVWKCYLYASISMSMNIQTNFINGKATPCVHWTISAYEDVSCYWRCDDTSWDSNQPWHLDWVGNDMWEFTASMTKCCGECVGPLAKAKEYFNEGSECGTGLKNLPAAINNFYKEAMSDNADFNNADRENLAADIVAYMSGDSAQEGWNQDPSTKDCATINGYCSGNTIT